MANVMNGDIIEFNGKACQAEIKGSDGTYIHKDGFAINVARGNKGYLTDLKTGYNFRAKWSDDTKILVKAEDVRHFQSAIYELKKNYKRVDSE